MAATIKVVTMEELDAVLMIIGNEGGIILVLNELTSELERAGVSDNSWTDYDFGGDPKYMIDVVVDKDDYFFEWLSSSGENGEGE